MPGLLPHPHPMHAQPPFLTEHCNRRSSFARTATSRSCARRPLYADADSLCPDCAEQADWEPHPGSEAGTDSQSSSTAPPDSPPPAYGSWFTSSSSSRPALALLLAWRVKVSTSSFRRRILMSTDSPSSQALLNLSNKIHNLLTIFSIVLCYILSKDGT